MQTSHYSDLLLRARYYQSASDVSTTPRRTQFKNIKETFIIFLCKDDPFGQGLPLYTERKTFAETDKIPYDDKTHKLFYNSSSFAKAENKEVREVLEFIYTLQANSDFTQSLEASAFNAKLSTSFKDEYMYFADILEEEKEEARATGLAEGKEQTKITNAKAFISLGKLTLEEIASCCNLPLSQVQNLALEIKNQ